MQDSGPHEETTPTLFSLVALPVYPGEYEVRVESLNATGPPLILMIEEDRLMTWLLARGCEFCAHAVKLGRSVYCDHPPMRKHELAGLGFNLG